jgi:hypothetical protein
MHFDELISCCIDAIKKYNPVIEGPDSFIEKYLKKVNKKIINKFIENKRSK